ncbi:MAG: AraC family ligand binding domain-containing protein [Patescibacteria group bacterium]|mgnify:CR=1 FL=1
MQIILPDSVDVQRYTGPGGYQVALTKVGIDRQVDVFGFHDIVIPAGQFSKEHHHTKFIELFYCLTAMRLKINDEMHSVPAGAMVVLQPGDRHEVYADDEVRFFAMKFPHVDGDKVVTS